MTRRQFLTGAAAIGGIAVAGAAGFGLWGSRGEAAWAEATAELRRALDPDGGMTELVRAATLAANSHNTQPWRFEAGARSISIRPDFARRTPVVDPDDHHLFVSLGCAAENIVQAAPVLGLAAAVGNAADEGVLVDLAPSAGGDAGRAEAIVRRQCTRSLYDKRAVGAGDLAALAVAAREDGVEMLLITEPKAVEDILALAVEGNTAQVTDPAFTAELKQWLRFSYGNALATADGLFSKCSGNPALPGPIGPLMFGFVYTADAENARLVEQVRSSSGLAIFVSEVDDRAHWVSAGRSYQRFTLEATARGIKHAFVNQPVEVPEMRQQLSALLGLGTGRPDLVVRFGYGPEMPMSLRRPVADVIAA